MKVLVLGAGLAGTTAAWHLAQAGHHVTVLDRRDAPAMETSFANGGQVSPCHAEPWANPQVLPKVLRWLGRDDAPLLFRWNRWDPALWAWGLHFLRNCTPDRAEINTERTLRIALYSRACLGELRSQLDLQYDQRRLGILHVYRNGRDFDQGCKAAETMGRFGLHRHIKTTGECLAIEPALTLSPALTGGIHTPDDESGDAHKFTQSLAEHCRRIGVDFRFGINVKALIHDAVQVYGAHTDQGEFRADAVVLALGSYSPLLARPAGVNLPIVPAKGYSITAAVGPEHISPHVSITDDEVKMVYSRLGDRLRAAGTAEMAGWNTDITPNRLELIRRNARALFPRGGDYDQAQSWTGLRPVTPDSVPLIGPTKLRGLWLNTGHGTLGWTMACGSGRLLAHMIDAKPTEIDPAGLGLDRF